VQPSKTILHKGRDYFDQRLMILYRKDND